jgi:hypothetical protein
LVSVLFLTHNLISDLSPIVTCYAGTGT